MGTESVTDRLVVRSRAVDLGSACRNSTETDTVNLINSVTLASLAVLFVACSSGASPEPEETTPPVETTSTADPLSTMRQDIAALESKPEHQAPTVKVQHLLVSFKGAPRMTKVERSKEEAEQLSAEIWQKIQAGEDFDPLVKQYTNDSHPGIYSMTVATRSGMVAGFGNVGWRLEVGEFGIAPWHGTKSPFGWHIIKRVE